MPVLMPMPRPESLAQPGGAPAVSPSAAMACDISRATRQAHGFCLAVAYARPTSPSVRRRCSRPARLAGRAQIPKARSSRRRPISWPVPQLHPVANPTEAADVADQQRHFKVGTLEQASARPSAPVSQFGREELLELHAGCQNSAVPTIEPRRSPPYTAAGERFHPASPRASKSTAWSVIYLAGAPVAHRPPPALRLADRRSGETTTASTLRRLCHVPSIATGSGTCQNAVRRCWAYSRQHWRARTRRLQLPPNVTVGLETLRDGPPLLPFQQQNAPAVLQPDQFPPPLRQPVERSL